MKPEPAFDLETRDHLPSAVRVLLEDYPRQHWEADPGYAGLIEFWLQRHMMFRRILAKLRANTLSRLAGDTDPSRFRSDFARLGSTFLRELHGHHSIEDMHYFPVLALKDSRVEAGFAILDRDHQILDAHLNGFADLANAALQANDQDRTAIGALSEELERLDRFLDRHLIDEEELVVPVILKFGAGGLG